MVSGLPVGESLTRLMALMDQPLVSVLIPAFNAEPWIAQCLESALAQTYPNIEILVADDGSTDRTPEIVEHFHARVRLIRAEHKGSNAARNLLLQSARGEWIQYLDADDYLLKHKIAAQMEAALGPTSPHVVCSPVILREENTGAERPLLFEEPGDIVMQFLHWGVLNTTGFLYRKQLLLDAGGWNEQQPACQEHELLLRLLKRGAKVTSLNEPGSVYRLHGTASVSRKDPLRTARLQSALLDDMQAYLQQNGHLSPQYRKALYISRLETARKTWPIDKAFASGLAKKARSTGASSWRTQSPALPASYRIMHALFGFEGAERIADFQRTIRSRRQL
jgi:glycosyltransferase involved in cell wall biosynthesis